MNKRIRYFSYYGCNDPERKRDNSPAADTKMDYIMDVLNRIGYDVEHVSLAQSSIPKYLSGYCEKKGKTTFRYFASLGKTTSLLRVLNRWFVHFQFLLWCLINLKRHEQVLVYHSLGYDADFLFLKKVKGIHIIGDIEEVYQDVSKQKSSQERNEYRFIKACDKYMFPNTILNECLNKSNKPFVVVHGIYKVNNYQEVFYNDGKIHVLYAGTYDPNKGGALASVKAAEYLNEHYHLHLTGFGTKTDEENVINEIKRVRPLTKCQITFHGYLDDAAFLDLMHHCSIGLCTQDPTNLLNLTSFPSKILNYMANGLVVLSGRNRAIEESAVGDIVQYYENQEPKEMANAILNIAQVGSVKERLNELDGQFEDSLKTLMVE